MNRDSTEWQSGVKEFLDFAFDGSPGRSTALCPCRRCFNAIYKERDEVHLDLLMNGMDPFLSFVNGGSLLPFCHAFV